MEGSIITPKKENKKKWNTQSIVIAIISLVTLIGGIISGVLIVRNKQLFEQDASVAGGVVQVTITPETKTVNEGETFTSKILLNTSNTAISALTIQLEYPFSGSEPPISATDIQISYRLITTSNWDFPIKSINSSNGKVIIRIAGFSNSISGFTSSGQEELATISFKANSAGNITAIFNQNESKVTKKTDGTDSLLIPESRGIYTVTGSTSTNTPTPSSTNSPTPTSTASASATPKITYPVNTTSPIPVSGANDGIIAIAGATIVLIVASVILAF